MLISEVQLRRFVEKYLSKLNQLSSEFSQENKLEIFPHFLIKPYEIIGIISRVHGLAIELVAEASKQSLKIFELDERIENAVLPQESIRNTAFNITGAARNIAFSGMGIYTKEFFEEYVKESEGTNLILQRPLDVLGCSCLARAFVDVSRENTIYL